MLWLRKKGPMYIVVRDLCTIIKLCYKDGEAFLLAEIFTNGGIYRLGSLETDHKIRYVFENESYETYEEFVAAVKHLIPMETTVRVLRSGLCDGMTLLESPWEDERLAQLAVH